MVRNQRTTYLPVDEVPELGLLQPPSIRIAPNTRVPFPREVAALVNHPLFQRLRGVRQLGFVDRLYPSANHTRFEHSLGVFHKTIYFIHALWGDPHSSFFRDVMGKRELRSVLIAALCHDLGQYPYSHVLEDTERDTEGNLPDDSVFDHEAYTRRLLSIPEFRKSVLAECAPDADDLDSVFEVLGVTSNDVLSVLTGCNIGELQDGTASILHSIIDGPIDADKLDYLQRDSHHAGVDFGSNIDEHRFYQSLTVIDEEVDPRIMRRQIAITEKGRVPAEEILIARWHMFTELYWHRTTRAHEAVLATAIRRLRGVYEDFDPWFRQAVLDPRATDEWFLRICHSLASGESTLGPTVRSGSEVRLILERCKQMLSSLALSAGRTQYKRLVSVSAANDSELYGILQQLRGAAAKNGTPLIDELIDEVALRIRSALNLNLDPLELVLDVPATRSPANTVWVASVESPRRGAIARLSERSPMWHHFGESFHDRTRKIRLFCTGSTRSKIRERTSSIDGEIKMYEILRESALKLARVAIQTDLFVLKQS